ncbi:MAG: right-handed parallel beta-helix repeat-containing protein [Ardenticatenia bacterium]|nr:right-handed parallel beta-helix repeat-containing protein [Ardenticatenia bacterium]
MRSSEAPHRVSRLCSPRLLPRPPAGVSALPQLRPGSRRATPGVLSRPKRVRALWRRTGTTPTAAPAPSSPWQTVQAAADNARPGDVVCVRGGVYNERVRVNVSGTADAPIVFRSYPGETAVLDGAGLAVPEADSAMVSIVDRAHIVFQGFEVRNFSTSERDRTPIGVLIAGTAHHVELWENRVHAIKHLGTWAEGTNAHGIAVYGTSGSDPVHDIIIHGNEVYDLRLGASEAIAINGNVAGWEVTANTVHDVDNIGIDAIGFEGTAPANDRARNGRIAFNHVYNVDSYGNPAYGTDRSAACIYVDGGRDILVENNRAHRCNVGVEIASEHAGGATANVIVRNNFISENTEVGLAMGGYDEGGGATEHAIVVNNTFYRNNTSNDWGAELYIQYDTRDTLIANNIVYAGDAGWLIRAWSTVMADNVVDYNLFYTTSTTPRWQWKGQTYLDFAAYQRGSGNDAHSLNAQDPLLVDPNVGDLHVRPSSPAVDAGHLLAESGSVDFDGDPRVLGSTIDIGADELGWFRWFLPVVAGG